MLVNNPCLSKASGRTERQISSFFMSSVENGNAARIVEQEKEKEKEEKEDHLKKQEMANTFSHVMSVGPTCISAMALQKAGLRTSATPLDWIFSSPAMIEHCLRDDWRMFLDADQYVDYGSIVSAKKKSAAAAAASSTADIFIGHSLYSTMVKKGKNESKIFLHRNPMVKEGKEYYERCVGRLRVVATSTSAVSLLLYVESSKRRSKHAVWVLQFRQLFRVLEEMWCGRFEFLVVRMQKSKKDGSSSDEEDVCKEVEVQSSSSGSILRVVHVLTDPEAPGLEDDRNLYRIIRAIHGRRNFNVVESSVLPRETTQGENGLLDELSKRPRRR